MAVGKSEDYEQAVKEAAENSFSKTAKVVKLNVGEEQTGTIEATVNLFQEGRARQRVSVSQEDGYWVAKTV